MYTLKRTNSTDLDFQILVNQLDQYLAIVNGDKNDFFVQYNKIDLIKYVLVAYEGNDAVGCGAMKEFAENTMEIKRMYVPLEKRGKGIAKSILNELQKWAQEMGYKKCILETGDKMQDAIGLYQKSDFNRIPNYGPYSNNETSICFEKEI
ncbi:MAG: GNAT family N-acetyltransferase [Saprospiraceae bacterium]|nr:GNAT family N-acetyltransferase [Saprospiraceae bacterium]MBK7811147.1 GNAT family N-acetyltransferase [Saprospiraceae bacterium]MBK9631153.1 GNAT family N-acetyltransferase [Saprospiraceae bacterium]